MDKRWAIVEGFDGAYRVSDAGDVESCHVPGARRRGSWRPWTRAIITEVGENALAKAGVV